MPGWMTRWESAMRKAASVSSSSRGPLQRPANHPTGASVQDHRQEHKLILQTDVGDIAWVSI